MRAAGAAALVTVAAAVLLSVAALAVVHVDDRYGVSAAAGVWMGLTSALLDGVLYPPVFDDGFYGGTRYMPLPFVLQAGIAAVTGELLVSAKLLVYTSAAGLYVLLYVVLRRRGAPWPVALGLIAAVLATAAGSLTAIAVRMDAMATLLQLAAVAVVLDRESSRRRVALAGLLCGLGLAAKISALWAPVALVAWLALVARGSLARFLAWFAGTSLVLGVGLQVLSSGRLFENVRLFAFGGSDNAPLLEGVHRFYQLGLRDQREGAVLILLAAIGVVAAARRRIGPYEIGFVVSLLLLLVLMRDAGTYENHLLDLLVLTSVVLAGMWNGFPERRLRRLAQGAVLIAVLAGTILASRYTLIPDMRAAASHELRGRPDGRFTLGPVGGPPGRPGCELFQDASIPLLAGERPVVLDAFMVHRLQTRRPRELTLLATRVQAGEFDRIVLNTPLTDVGWFAVLDFGSEVAGAMRENYELATQIADRNLWVYVPKLKRDAAVTCRRASLSEW